MIAASLERFATEIRHLQRTEVREVREPFAEGQAGSSAMPHKRNPEKAERVCGLARTIRANAMTALENVALWHERDISHTSAERIAIPDACFALDYITDMLAWIVDGLVIDADRMQANLESSYGLIYSQRVMLALTEAGVGRDDAYKRVQSYAMKAWDEGIQFRDLIEQDDVITSALNPAAMDAVLRPHLLHPAHHRLLRPPGSLAPAPLSPRLRRGKMPKAEGGSHRPAPPKFGTGPTKPANTNS